MLKFRLVKPVEAPVTVYDPETVLAVNAGAVASPLESVVIVELVANVPVAPVEGVVKTTLTPGTALPKLSLAKTCKLFANAAPTVADWLLPFTIAIVLAAPGEFVRLKFCEVTPVAEALIV
jgi:hypothetical protein